MTMSGIANGAGMSGMAGCSSSHHSQMKNGATNKSSDNQKIRPANTGQSLKP